MKKQKLSSLDRFKLNFEYNQTLAEIKLDLKSRIVKA